MNAQRLWHYLAVIFVVVGIIGLSIKHLFVDQSKWERVSGQALYNKLQTELAQVYWQWQRAGRPNAIEYQPQNAAGSKIINMDGEGRLLFAHTKKGCEVLLSWFVDQKALNYQVQVSTTSYVSSGRSEQNFACRFEYANYVYVYLADARELKLTQVE